MIGVVLVSHGDLASELLRAAEIIAGKIENTVTVDISPKMGMEEIHTAVEAAIRTVDTGKGVLLLIDMFGGTPSNIGLSFLATHQVEVVTGVNLPMMVKLPVARQTMSLPELAKHLLEYGRRNITNPGEMLKKKAEK
ncbi:MAG: PTS sugar transporter subunit IIA [Deltaproteobacteria bacterium]|jgi:PTS system mannose-specific IIA component|nr:PTS sugar transporter subunit IIA [Deltaproteobacteria bacterium]TFG61377.1 MAG: PTS sugar transporter subunit IIA [Deltaproteobacteria bacterium]